jgi:hypothetical protein
LRRTGSSSSSACARLIGRQYAGGVTPTTTAKKKRASREDRLIGRVGIECHAPVMASRPAGWPFSDMCASDRCHYDRAVLANR